MLLTSYKIKRIRNKKIAGEERVRIINIIYLLQGDRVIIGGDHYFRFNHPASVDPSGKRTSTGAPKDFQFAKQEIEKTQNDR